MPRESPRNPTSHDHDHTEGSTTTSTHSLLKLPGEIRNRLYELVLEPPLDPTICLTGLRGLDHESSIGHDYDNHIVSWDASVAWKGHYYWTDPSLLSILLTSKQIYTEAFHVFYSTHCFSFIDTEQLYRFLRNIGYVRRQDLTMIYFVWRGEFANKAFRLLKTCSKLKTLQFTVPCSHAPGYAALREVRGLETVKVLGLVHFRRHPHRRPRSTSSNQSGDYYCRCHCQKRVDLISVPQELETAMTGPRLARFELDASQTFNLFRPKREWS